MIEFNHYVCMFIQVFNLDPFLIKNNNNNTKRETP